MPEMFVKKLLEWVELVIVIWRSLIEITIMEHKKTLSWKQRGGRCCKINWQVEYSSNICAKDPMYVSHNLAIMLFNCLSCSICLKRLKDIISLKLLSCHKNLTDEQMALILDCQFSHPSSEKLLTINK